MRKLCELVVLIKGGGELGSTIGHHLHRSHFRVCLTEIAKPLAVNRGTAFSEAVFDGVKTIEGVTAELALRNPQSIMKIWEWGNIPIVIDSRAKIKNGLNPDVLIDAISAKTNTGTNITDAPFVIGLGPGFIAGYDVHAVIDTFHDNNLGRLILDGQSRDDTTTPILINGLSRERVVWAEQAGLFSTSFKIGNKVKAGDIVAQLLSEEHNNIAVTAPASGIIRGLMRNGVLVPKNAKILEIDPQNDSSVCNVIRDKYRAIAGGVLEAIMAEFNVP